MYFNNLTVTYLSLESDSAVVTAVGVVAVNVTAVMGDAPGRTYVLHNYLQ